MKKNGFRFLAPLLSVGLMLTACHHQTLEDRAEKECKDYTAQYCPTPYQGNTRTDSIGFNRASRTFNYYYLVNGKLDDARIFTARHDTLRTILLSGLKEDTRNKAFKDKGTLSTMSSARPQPKRCCSMSFSIRKTTLRLKKPENNGSGAEILDRTQRRPN